MKCQRCINDKEAEFRVVTDVLDIKVCADCASEARRLGTTLQVFEIGKNGDRSKNSSELRGYATEMPSVYTH